MKKRTKIGLGATLFLGVVALTSCTQSFCSPVDTARIMCAFDPGITYYEADETAPDLEFNRNGWKVTLKHCKPVVAEWVTATACFHFADETKGQYLRVSTLNEVISAVREKGFSSVNQNTVEYFRLYDRYLLEDVLFYYAQTINSTDLTIDIADYPNGEKSYAHAQFDRVCEKYSFLKYISGENGKMWDNFDSLDARVRAVVESDKCPKYDFIAAYTSAVYSKASVYRTCLTTKEDKYGTYGYSTEGVYINAKSWGYAWSKGFFEGLLVWPMGWLIDNIVSGFRGVASSGWSAFWGIVFVTLIVRSLMLLITFKQTKSTAKMTELQPEIQKIQNKYPNANTSYAEKQRMAEEMNRLYKKNKVNPFTSILIMILQFPIFICVWGALSGASAITNGTLLGMRLDLGIKDILFIGSNWGPAGNYSAVTAFILFLLMAGTQTISMLLPQWIQKAKAKKVAKLGKNPAQKSQNRTMKIFTYVMLALIIFMGFSLVSAMGIYWFVGAVFTILQTIITTVLTNRSAKKK